MIERLNPSARADRYGNRINRVQSPWRATMVPYASIVLGSLLPFLILADLVPLIPPLGFMMLVCWRLMQPGLMPMWVGIPLGAVDDLLSGQPFGSAILLFSLTLIVLELIETRFPWRGFWQDWFTAGLAITLYILFAMVVSGSSLTGPMVIGALPQVAMAIALYPLLARFTAGLDRFRLSRSRRIG